MKTFEFDVITLFPEMFVSPFSESILKRGLENGVIEIRTHNLRDFAPGKHRVVDDAPYGGGAGMVMKAEPLVNAIEKVRRDSSGRVILLTPQGDRFTDSVARSLSLEEKITIVCGRYEGVDERVRDYVDMEISIGDYILTGGELAAMVMIDSISRFIPGILGDERSAGEDSFAGQLLEYPQYTRPASFRDKQVPEVLLSGDHQAIREWRREQSIRRTFERRNDMLASADLSGKEREYLDRMMVSHNE